jgi:hypothetical protein
VGDIIDWITDTARRPTRVLALGQETDFYGSQLSIHKLPTTIIAATIIAATIAAAIAAAITDGTITTATIAITAAAAARRRRRRRRNPDSTTAAAAAAPTATAIPSAATPATRTNVPGTIVALCFDVGGNGGRSECEGRCEHGGYPA